MSIVNDKTNTEQPIIAKKRGRKSKKELEIAAQQLNAVQNIIVSIEESPTNGSVEENVNIDFLIKKKGYLVAPAASSLAQLNNNII